MNKFMKIQRKKIEIDKWCEGLVIHRDPGDEYVINWIFKNAGWFRRSWEQSCCKSCQFSEESGYNTLEECERYSAHEY
jgi:hypothetical protein